MDAEREILIDLVRLIHTLGCISGELRGLKTICDAKEEDVFLLDSVIHNLFFLKPNDETMMKFYQ